MVLPWSKTVIKEEEKIRTVEKKQKLFLNLCPLHSIPVTKLRLLLL